MDKLAEYSYKIYVFLKNNSNNVGEYVFRYNTEEEMNADYKRIIKEIGGDYENIKDLKVDWEIEKQKELIAKRTIKYESIKWNR